MTPRALLAALTLLATSCAGGPERRDDVPPPTLVDQELQVAEQGLTDFTVALQGNLVSAAQATLVKASYELVVDGKVMKSGELPLNVTLTASAPTRFELRESSRYVASANELKELDQRAGTLLTAIRGKLFVRQGEKEHVLDYARSREIRLPRLPKVNLKDMDAARYSDTEVNGTLYLGVLNPNPFPIALTEVTYALQVSGKKVVEGSVGQGEKIDASSTGVFEIPFTVNEATLGKDVKKQVGSRTLPYEATGEARGELFQVPYSLTGDIRLNVSK